MRRLLRLLKYYFFTPIYILRNVNISPTATYLGKFIKDSQVGKFTYIGYNTIINSAKIGNYVSIAAGVQIGGMEHDIDWYSTSTKVQKSKYIYKKTLIGNNTWIGANAIIKQGVKIGDGCVIGGVFFC